MKKIIIVFCTVFFVQFVKAQLGPVRDSARAELYRINQVFEHNMYLGFNMDISYRADSANITVETEQQSGNYVINKKNMYYNMGGTEYIQTDSFSYTIYADNKTIIMGKNEVQPSNVLTPLNGFLDSLVDRHVSYYDVSMDTIQLDSADYIKRINFVFDTAYGTDTGLAIKYSSFNVAYDEGSHRPSKLSFSYWEDVPVYISDTVFNGYIKELKHVDINFSGYRAFTNTEIFNDIQYVIYNRQRKIYEPADKYKNYQFITTGFENEEADN